MTLVMAESDGHTHVWHLFETGQGCRFCTAWQTFRTPDTLIDALPTSLLQQPPRPDYGASVPTDDLGLDVMNDLLEIARADVSWMELEALASRIIVRVRGTLG